MNSKDDNNDLLTPTSPLNTPLDDLQPPGCSKHGDYIDLSEEEDRIPSYQPPVNPSRDPDRTAKQPKDGENRKRKADENLYTLEAKIQRTEESIKKLKVHLENKTCPKLLRYSAWANIPLEEQFKKDVQAVNQKAEQGFISALTRFNYRRPEKLKTKLCKGKGKTLRKGTPERGNKHKSKEKLLSADISVKSLASILGINPENVPTLLSTLKEAVNNKDVKKNKCPFTECSSTANTITDNQNKRKVLCITSTLIAGSSRVSVMEETCDDVVKVCNFLRARGVRQDVIENFEFEKQRKNDLPSQNNELENSLPERKPDERRGTKRKYTDHRSVEAKIAKTEESISKLDKHLNSRTCPKSLQYTARANITPDNDFQKEIRDIKVRAEQAFVNALSRFHNRRLESLKKKVKARPTVARTSTNVNRERHFESRKKDYPVITSTDEKLSKLEQKLTDLTNIVSTHLINNCQVNNKKVESYNSVFSELLTANTSCSKSISLSKKTRRKKRQKNIEYRRAAKERETNEKFLKNFSNHELTDSQVSVIPKGLKFIPTPVSNETEIKRQLLRDFELFARRMRLKYIFHGQNKEPHPFHVKSDWTPPVQQSVALESYLENVKLQLTEIKIMRPKNNLSRDEIKAIAELIKGSLSHD
ncbi:hypothetical protein ACROYT_G015545 [Oculina patagonica]